MLEWIPFICRQACIGMLNKYSVDIEGACAGAAVYSKECLKSICINNKEYFKNDFFAMIELFKKQFKIKE